PGPRKMAGGRGRQRLEGAAHGHGTALAGAERDAGRRGLRGRGGGRAAVWRHGLLPGGQRGGTGGARGGGGGREDSRNSIRREQEAAGYCRPRLLLRPHQPGRPRVVVQPRREGRTTARRVRGGPAAVGVVPPEAPLPGRVVLPEGPHGRGLGGGVQP